MGYTNSPLVSYTKLAPRSNYGGARTHAIDTVAIHCVVGQASVETLGKVFANPNRKASSNYGVGYDGRIGMYCEEKNRSYCTSSAKVDQRAITIEVASDSKHPYAVTDAAYNGLIKLLVDVCQRNNIKQLIWKENKEDRVNRIGGANMMVHRDWAAKACVPVQTTEVLTFRGWVPMDKVKPTDSICVCSDTNTNLAVFEPINGGNVSLTPVHVEDTLIWGRFEATPDHRVIHVPFGKEGGTVHTFEDILTNSDFRGKLTVPGACVLKNASLTDQFSPTSERMRLLAALMSNQYHVCEDMDCACIRDLTEAQAMSISELLDIEEETATTVVFHSNKVRISLKLYEEVTQSFVDEKGRLKFGVMIALPYESLFNFIHEFIQVWNVDTVPYNELFKENIKTITALAALCGFASYTDENDRVVFINGAYHTINETTELIKEHANQLVACIQTTYGAFLCRQNGRTFVTGNCPGDYLYERQQDIANKVNALLGGANASDVIKPEQKPDSSITNASLTFRKGDRVRIAEGAMYYNGKAPVPSWVIVKEWYLASVTTTDKVVIGKSVDGANNINSAISARYLIKVGGDGDSGGNTTGTEAGKYTIYKVKRGDTLSKIAKTYNTTVSALAKYNNITNVNFLSVGQEIKIPL